jgi:hypothetical protein
LKVPGEDPESAIPVLVIVDDRTECVFSKVAAKGMNPYAIHLVTEALIFLGRQKVVLFTDSEHSIWFSCLSTSASNFQIQERGSWTARLHHVNGRGKVEQ